MKLGKKELILDFEGSFCRTCGVYDYLEDFIYELEKFVDVSVKIKSFKEYKSETIRVKYALKHAKWHTPEETIQLIEAGFEYVCSDGDLKYFRKRK